MVTGNQWGPRDLVGCVTSHRSGAPSGRLGTEGGRTGWGQLWALSVRVQWGISPSEQEQQTRYSTRGFTKRWGFCQEFCRGPLWREHSVPDLFAVHLAHKTPSCVGFCFSSPSLPAFGLFCEEKQFNQSLSWGATAVASEERMRGRCLLLPPAAEQGRAALHIQHPCHRCSAVFQLQSQLYFQRNENTYMHNLCRRHQRYEAKQLWKHLLMFQPLPILETSSMINHIFQLTLIFFSFNTKLAKNLSYYKCICMFAIYSPSPYFFH